MKRFITRASALNARQYSGGTPEISIAWPPGMPGAATSIRGVASGIRDFFKTFPHLERPRKKVAAGAHSGAIQGRCEARAPPKFPKWADEAGQQLIAGRG